MLVIVFICVWHATTVAGQFASQSVSLSTNIAPVDKGEEYISDPIDENLAPEFMPDGTILESSEEMRAEFLDKKESGKVRKVTFLQWSKEGFLNILAVRIYAAAVMASFSLLCLWSAATIFHAFYATDPIVFPNENNNKVPVTETIEIVIQ